MKEIKVDLLIIGAGPAGLAAAIHGKKLGINDVLIVERNNEAGGILQQCIHDGFGLQRFKETLSGPQYVQKQIDEAEKLDVKIMLNTMVVDMTKDREVFVISSESGLTKITATAVILAMGCRERSRMQAHIMGSRPRGVLTAGTVQRYINKEGLIPGEKAVILGSGDIGLIMARRMTLEDVKVEGVYEIMNRPGGLQRNISQCLDDYNIPLHLSTTVTEIHGKYAVEGVTVQQVDDDYKPIPNTQRYIPCDLLVLSVGLIPENEISLKADVPLSEQTNGPIIDNNFMTMVPGIFAAGNVVSVFDLTDNVSRTGEIAASGAFEFIKNGNILPIVCKIEAGKDVTGALPIQYRSGNSDKPLEIFCRVKKVLKNAVLTVSQGDRILFEKKYRILRPQEMLNIEVKPFDCGTENIVISVCGEEEGGK
ncbi:MAG: FAD-dependent oxidoreductase [Ruminococcaceae bacterium]|nr:FAD-dependent oxidoreductase [Oscillospiraceae bacterium]